MKKYLASPIVIFAFTCYCRSADPPKSLVEDKLFQTCTFTSIVFEENTFEVFGRILVNLNSVDGFVFRGNIIKKSEHYPLASTEGPVFNINTSKNILIEKNECLWDEPATIV